MALQVDIKKGSTVISSLSQAGETFLDTKDKYVNDYISVEVVQEGHDFITESDPNNMASYVTSSNLNYVIKYTGTDTATYKNNRLYVVSRADWDTNPGTKALLTVDFDWTEA